MTKVYACAIFCSTGLRFGIHSFGTGVLDAGPPLARWARHVEDAYDCAFGSCFNDFYARSITVRHLRGMRFRMEGELGEVWSDWVYLVHKKLGIRAIHLHFCFPDLTLRLHDPTCTATQALAAFLCRVYELTEKAAPGLPPEFTELSRILCAAAKRRKTVLGISRYVHTSLACDDATFDAAFCRPGAGTAPLHDGGLATNFYRLLYQHATGVDPDVARQALPAPWSSTAFFRLYSQPAGVLAVSKGFPENRSDAWYLPNPPHLAEAPSSSERRDYPDYDLLPEYPPLRHLGLPLLQYAAAYEETLRAVYESAFKAGRLPFRTYRKQHLLASNFEGVRWPVTRPFVDSLLDQQLQERTTNAVMERLRIRESRWTFALAVVAIVTALFLDRDKVTFPIDLAAIVSWMK